jgi:hypothetical protein
MNLKSLPLAVIATATAIAVIPVGYDNFFFTDFVRAQSQLQEMSINLDSSDLSWPHVLSIHAPRATQLNGKIELDGRLLRNVTQQNTEINLSPYLSKGQHVIVLSGRYSPSNASVQVKFNGANSQISQQVSGSGSFNQTFTIEVEE